MLMGIMGKMGEGKTLTMSVLATYLAKKTGAPLFANYHLRGAEYFNNVGRLWEMDTAIVCLDELWLTMDSRLWKDNVALTRFINQTRKKKLVIMYTTQHINQIELRVRRGTDILVFCQKVIGGHWLNFLDYQYMQLGRRFLLPAPEKFYHIYDTFEVLEPLKMDWETKNNAWTKNTENITPWKKKKSHKKNYTRTY